MLSKIKSYFKNSTSLKKSEILGVLNFLFFGMPLLFLIIGSSYFIIVDYMIEDNKYDISEKLTNLSYQVEGKDIRRLDKDFIKYEITYEDYKKHQLDYKTKSSKELEEQIKSEIVEARNNDLINKMINNSRFFAKQLDDEYHLVATDQFLNVSEYSLHLKNKTIKDYNNYVDNYKEEIDKNIKDYNNYGNNYKEEGIIYKYGHKFENEDRLFYKYGVISELNVNQNNKYSEFSIGFYDFCVGCDIKNKSKIKVVKEQLNLSKTSIKKYSEKEALEYRFTYNSNYRKFGNQNEYKNVLNINYYNGQLLSYTGIKEKIYPILKEESKLKKELKDTLIGKIPHFSFIFFAYIFFYNITNRLKRKEEKEEILKEKEEEITKKIEKKYREKDKEIKIEKEKILKI